MGTCAIVVPCYNEAGRLHLDAFRQFDRKHGTRFWMVNDGSTDRTRDMLAQLVRSQPERFRLLDLPRNGGKAEAVRQGVLAALAEKPAFVGFWDADLATPLAAIPSFCQLLESRPELHMVVGARVNLLGRSIHRRAVRHYLGRIFATAASRVLRLPIYDTQCGAKLFRATRETAELFAQPFRTNWVFDVELLARFARSRRRSLLPAPQTAIYELPLQQWHDVAGSKVKPHDFMRAVYELLTIYVVYSWGGGGPRAAAPALGWPAWMSGRRRGQPRAEPWT